MKSLFIKIISLLFPERCVVCKKDGTSLCTSCIQTLPVSTFLEEPWMHSLFSYQDSRVRAIVHALKFDHTQSIGDIIAPLINDLIKDIEARDLIHKQKPLTIIPVPRMQVHVKKRGFDAVSYISKALYAQDTTKYEIHDNIVIRTNTKAQVGLGRQERLTNMKDAFKILNTHKIQDRRICIIDDVTTTGSTLRELRNNLLQAGTREVFAVTIAH